MLKQELRKIYKEKRKNLSFSQKEKMNDLLLIQFQKLEIEIPSLIMTYAAIEKMNEFDPGNVMDYCQFKNPSVQFVYPVMQQNETKVYLKSVLVNEDTVFSENKLNIFEPVNGIETDAQQIEMVITPLLCFDRFGNRVGYGKGFYDSFFSGCKKDCIKIGFSYFDVAEQIEDINEQDIPLDYCITTETIYRFTN